MATNKTSIVKYADYQTRRGNRKILSNAELLRRFKIVIAGMEERLTAKQIRDKYKLNLAAVVKYRVEIIAASKLGYKTVEDYLEADRPCMPGRRKIL